jgi:outer membrane immunogenic protein
MRKLFLLGMSTFAAVMLGGAAQAADMPLQAPPVDYSWAGSYVGLNAGYGWGRFKVKEPTEFDASGVVFHYANFNFDNDGWLFGMQNGYNWQSGPWVFGYEADLQIASIDGSITFPAAIFSVPSGTFNTVVDSKLNWFGTFRARLGYSWTPTTLIYGTGGFAYGEVRSQLAFPLIGGAPTSFFALDTHTLYGYAAGGGIEYKIAQNVSLKAEYLYVSLGNKTHSFLIANDTYTWRERVELHTARVGVNVQYQGLLDTIFRR